MTHKRTSIFRAGRLWLIPCLLLAQPVLAGPAGAAEAQPASATQPTGGAEALTGQQAQLAQHRAKVERLQQRVGQLESQNGQASSRLQQQDRDIAELRRQLQAARGAAPTGSDHH